MDATPNLELPMIMAAQAQKHVTHNEALRRLDVLVNTAILDRDLAAPPASPANGDCYIVASGATGAWAGHAAAIAAWQDGAWAFYPPAAGFVVWVADESALLVWSGTAWTAALAVNPAPLVGVNAAADTTNRLSVSSPATLFNHAGAGHQLKVNKSATGQTASQLFQTAFSGRAEVGLTGDDNFHFKVSPDGTTWRDALVLVAATGLPRVPSLGKAALPSASTSGAGALVHVADEAGGATLAFSDGTSWRRVTDRAVVS
jgi:hypothetical protein